MKQKEFRELLKKHSVSSYSYSVWVSKQCKGKQWGEIEHEKMLAKFANNG